MSMRNIHDKDKASEHKASNPISPKAHHSRGTPAGSQGSHSAQLRKHVSRRILPGSSLPQGTDQLAQALLSKKAQRKEVKSSPAEMLQEAGLLIRAIDSVADKNLRNAHKIQRELQASIASLTKATKDAALEREKIAVKELEENKEANKAKFETFKAEEKIKHANVESFRTDPTPILVILMRVYYNYLESSLPSEWSKKYVQTIAERALFAHPEVIQILDHPQNTREDEQLRYRAALAILQSETKDSNRVLQFLVAAAFDSIAISILDFDKEKINVSVAKDHTDMIEDAIDFLQIEVQRAEQEVIGKEIEREVEDELSEERDYIEEEEKSAVKETQAAKELEEKDESALDAYVASLNALVRDESLTAEDALILLEKYKNPGDKDKAQRAVKISFDQLEETCAAQDALLIRRSALFAPQSRSSQAGLFLSPVAMMRARKGFEALSASMDALERCSGSAEHARKSSKA